MEIQGYHIIREIGQGGMAKVYLAVQESLNRNVALKVMSPALAADPSYAARFHKEGKTIALLNHPHIIKVFDVGATGDFLYLATEYLSGGDLKSRIKDKKLGSDEVFQVFTHLAEALAYAHDKGFVHRDIKPENVLFDDQGRPVLTDFGIARAMGSDTRITKTGMSIGTPHYMSPEQARGRLVDGRSDLYSLGILLYEMLTGRVPYDAEESLAIGIKHLQDPVPQLPETFSKSHQIFLDRLLAKNPDDRFGDAEEMLAVLEKLQRGEELPAPPKKAVIDKTQIMTSVQESGRKRHGPGMYVLGGLMLALVAAAAGWHMFYEPPPPQAASVGGETGTDRIAMISPSAEVPGALLEEASPLVTPAQPERGAQNDTMGMLIRLAVERGISIRKEQEKIWRYQDLAKTADQLGFDSRKKEHLRYAEISIQNMADYASKYIESIAMINSYDKPALDDFFDKYLVSMESSLTGEQMTLLESIVAVVRRHILGFDQMEEIDVEFVVDELAMVDVASSS